MRPIEEVRRSMIRSPAPNPCGSCPYRKDVPSGVWETVEYEKLPEYDKPTGDQPIGVFLCHRQDGHVCAGWAGCHDMENALAVRLALARGVLEDVDSLLDYETDTPLWASGADAAAHGLAGIDDPDVDAKKVIDKLSSAAGRMDH